MQKICGICAHHGSAPRRPPITRCVKKLRRVDNTDDSHVHSRIVKRSLAENELTVVSIFVNPAQFAPHEDLATYPRTLPHDLNLLSALEYQPTHPPGTPRTPSAVFVPSVKDMYPSGISQDASQQKGTFVEVKGYGEQMEGRSRPTFFRGVATVVTKLFNIIQVRKVSPEAFCAGPNFQLSLSRRTRTLVRRISNKHSSCVASPPTCTSPIQHLVTYASSQPPAIPQTASLCPRVMHISPPPSANLLLHSTRLSSALLGHGQPVQANRKQCCAR